MVKTLSENKNKIQSEIVLIAFDVNKSKKFLNDNTEEYKRFLNTQKIIRDVDEIHIIDLNKKLLFTSLKAPQTYIPPIDKALNLVLDDDRPLKIINAPENISASIMRLQNYENRFLYVVNYLDKNSYYPWHNHEAEELYFIVAGEAKFESESEKPKILRTTDTRFHKSYEAHRITTTDSKILSFVIWKNKYENVSKILDSQNS